MTKAERLRRLISKLLTIRRLGVGSVARVGAYRLGLKTGIHSVLRVRSVAAAGPFFIAPQMPRNDISPPSRWNTDAEFFSAHRFPLDGVPDWHANPFNPGKRASQNLPWYKIPDFDPDIGDIKAVWEISRFDWLLPMAQRAAVGDEGELMRLNAWLEDWSERNPPYDGANWKCGQEASIRVIHLAIAALMLQNHLNPSGGLLSLLRTHLLRIAPTIGYAIGQNNNHGTSEAAALFIGGSWLAQHSDPDANAWMDSGRRWLENRAKLLIENDGTFSQYSVVYHRLMIDTYSACEVWRLKFDLQPFSGNLKSKLARAVGWQRQMLDSDTGHVPNIGANDGARLIALGDEHFRDFRPSTQLAAALFCDARAIADDGAWDIPLCWLGITSPTAILPPLESASLSDGGFHILRAGQARCYFRSPKYRFRPSQCDALHIDLWTGSGLNLIRDGGTYSYNCTEKEYLYFSGSRSHNVAEFDSRDQMPRIGRFLFGSWLQNSQLTAVETTGSGVRAQAGYRDYCGSSHVRRIALMPRSLRCEDTLDGRAAGAVIRWRLPPSDWRLEANVLTDGIHKLAITSRGSAFDLKLATGTESLHYMEKTPVAVLEISCTVPSIILTEISF
jgi:hypothetical protein